MASPRFCLPPQQFANVFPFHLVFDRELKIVQTGTVLQRMYPDMSEGRPFKEYFRIKRPNIALNFDAVCDRANSLFLIESIQNTIQLRGQMICLKQLGHIFFLGSPLIKDIATLKNLGLTLKDFAIHDPITDYLFLLQAKNTALSDAQKLLKKLTQQRAALRESEERYALVMKGANDGIWDWNLKTDEVYFSTRWKTMLGHQEHEISNSLDEWFSRVHPEDLDWIKLKISEHLDGLTTHFESEYRMRHQDGTYRWILSRGLGVRDENGCAHRMAGSQTDITEHKQAEAKLLYDAFHDSLTGLPNRALLMERLQHAVQLAKRNQNYLFAVLFLDLDRFKLINDSLGHAIGDRLLVAIAQRLVATLRPGDTIARLGGDEFVLLVEDITNVNCANEIAERIQQQLALPFNIGGHEVFTNVSIGIALSINGYERSEDLLRDADTAMYRAKAQGLAQYETFNVSMHSRAMARLQIETDLRRSIERQELQLYYQPIVSLGTLRIKGFEVLLRWQHPDRGLIPPSEFIPIAEETGLILPIGWWVLKEACRQLQKWHQQFTKIRPLIVSVNLSAKQFTREMVEQISQILHETHLESCYLRLEITESLLLENAQSAATMLSQLKDLGVRVALDDFGTGYSSLSYLHQFPIDILKIDRSFINKLETDIGQLAIVRAIITLAWNLSMEVIAEGIETPKQLSQLRSLKCRYGQGHFFAKPVKSNIATQLIAAGLPMVR